MKPVEGAANIKVRTYTQQAKLGIK